MHIYIDQGGNFSKLAKEISKFQSWENYFWRTLVAFWPTVQPFDFLHKDNYSLAYLSLKVLILMQWIVVSVALKK